MKSLLHKRSHFSLVSTPLLHVCVCVCQKVGELLYQLYQSPVLLCAAKPHLYTAQVNLYAAQAHLYDVQT